MDIIQETHKLPKQLQRLKKLLKMTEQEQDELEWQEAIKYFDGLYGQEPDPTDDWVYAHTAVYEFPDIEI